MKNGMIFIFRSNCDAAVLWKKNSYIKGKYVYSFQPSKTPSLGEEGLFFVQIKLIIDFKKMSYDERMPEIAWRDQNRYYRLHYYMTLKKKLT